MRSAGFRLALRPGRVPRPDGVESWDPLVPLSLVSWSVCLMHFVPDTWCIGWTGDPAAARRDAMTRFGWTPAGLADVQDDLDPRVGGPTLGWPGVFFDAGDARRFAARIETPTSQLTLVELCLADAEAERFIAAATPLAGHGAHGEWTALQRRAPVGAGRSLGFEVLCWHQGWCAATCNSLAAVFRDDLGISPNERGHYDSLGDARRCALWASRPDVGAERGEWLAGELRVHPLG